MNKTKHIIRKVLKKTTRRKQKLKNKTLKKRNTNYKQHIRYRTFKKKYNRYRQKGGADIILYVRNIYTGQYIYGPLAYPENITLQDIYNIFYNIPGLSIINLVFEPQADIATNIITAGGVYQIFSFQFEIQNNGSIGCRIDNGAIIADLANARLILAPPPLPLQPPPPPPEIGQIQVYGGRQRFLNTATNASTIFGPPYTNVDHFFLLPNDIVTFSLVDGWTINSRIPQTICGLVTNINNIDGYKNVILNYISLPSGSLFSNDMSPILQEDARVVIDSRIVFIAQEDTTFDVVEIGSSEAEDDVRVLVSQYGAAPPRAFEAEGAGDPLYTQNYIGGDGQPRNIMQERGLRTFTIDPATSQDFDDAISVDVVAGTVYVHIVDIANVPLNAGEIERLQNRCFTLYLANEHTEHLLDEETAQVTLSLNANVPRNVVTVEMRSNGTFDIYRSIIIVDQRYSYEEVLGQLEGGIAPADITHLDARAQIAPYGANIALPSLRLNIDPATGLLIDYRLEESTDRAHMLVANAMIEANKTVAEHLHNRGIVIPNRLHPPPRGGHQAPVITGIATVDSFLVIKGVSQALYDPARGGHDGLGLAHYVHFTSPMRRYADVIIHKLLAGKTIPDIDQQTAHINNRESIVKNIEIAYKNLKLLRYLQLDPARIYEAYVIKVTGGGVSLFIPEFLLEHFVLINLIRPAQHWFFNANTLTGNLDPQHIIRIGNRYRVTMANILPLEGKFTLILDTNIV